MRRGDRGQIRIIEAFLAVAVIFSSLAISTNLTMTSNSIKRTDLESVGLQVMLELDSEGKLANYVVRGDWPVLGEAIALVLPEGVCFSLSVYDNQLQRLNPDSISNGSFASEDVAFVEYICSTRTSVFQCYILRLQLGLAVS